MVKKLDFIAIVVVLATIASGLLIWTSAPCGLWSLSKVGDMPARCLSK
ncbi:hypothetical protein [Streptodolium elevatio]|uniref:Uncharacterized protein n=1 Tax=Streptodolium elevatio TaxID=3157996 RepID=A0ABV3DDY8_9ACTN